AGSKPNALRRSGLIPAVLYGHNGVESISLTVPAKAAEILVRDGSLNNTLVDISIPDQSWNGKALLREIQSHPWKGYLYHLSFFSVGSQSSLEVDVPLHVVGEAPGVKVGGGSLELMLNQLRVQCAPDRIPDAIEVDVSEMEVGQFVHVADLRLPEGVLSSGEPDRVVVTVLPPGEE
ncbi:MAG TPA: 50S ribosomal protein L25/general stress protein Ctc, partial [Thermosynechococcaceae cyanobacterium]